MDDLFYFPGDLAIFIEDIDRVVEEESDDTLSDGEEVDDE